MIDALAAHIASHADVFGPIDPTALSFTKFCQRIVQPHTKVLFLVTHKGTPLCIIKMMRDASFNPQLEKEEKAQQSIAATSAVAVPRVYFHALVEGRHMYAEEVVVGLPVSQRALRAQEGALVAFVVGFPRHGSQPAAAVAERIAPHVPPDRYLEAHLQVIRESGAMLETGVTHGDLGRPNILAHKKLWVLDWERAGECPFALIDAVQVITQARGIETLEDWKLSGAPVLCEYAGIASAEAHALWSLRALFDRLYKRYPLQYQKVAAACQTFV